MGFWLLVPFFLVRFGLLSLRSKEAIGRAAHFAPLVGRERAAYWVYQVSNVALLVVLFFFRIESMPLWLLVTGWAVYGLGVLLLAVSVVNFAAPAESGINQNGLYRFSRNPMYVAYFVFFMGCVLLTQSLVMLGILLVFQVSARWIIRAEERWCMGTFGEEYRRYMARVRRYL